MVGKGVGSGEQSTGNMDHFEIKVSKVNEPSCLMTVECLGLSEVGEVLVIGEHLYQKRRPMKVMLPGLQGMDDSKEFSVIDIIVLFCGRE